MKNKKMMMNKTGVIIMNKKTINKMDIINKFNKLLNKILFKYQYLNQYLNQFLN